MKTAIFVAGAAFGAALTAALALFYEDLDSGLRSLGEA